MQDGCSEIGKRGVSKHVEEYQVQTFMKTLVNPVSNEKMAWEENYLEKSCKRTLVRI